MMGASETERKKDSGVSIPVSKYILLPEKNMKLHDHDKTAVIWNDRNISYAELLQKVGAYASLYRTDPGNRVAVFAENRPEWIYAFLSIWRHHAIAVPVDAGLPAADAAYLLGDCRPSVIFCSERTNAVLQKALSSIPSYIPDILVFEQLQLPASGFAGDENHDEDETAVIIYTSGTTGNPKGVMLSFSNLLSSIRGLQELRMLRSDDRIFGMLPFHHIFPLQGTLIGPLYCGATSILIDSLSSEEILRAARTHRPTMFLGVPRLYELFHKKITAQVKRHAASRLMFSLSKKLRCMRASRIMFSKIQSAFGGKIHAYLAGGAAFDRSIADDLRALGFDLVEGYGLTETSPLVAFNRFGRVRPGSVGQILGGIDVKIEDEEILVKGPNVMKGYWNRPEETAKRIRDGWLHTGDKGYFDRDGYLFITGRIDEMIVLPSGKNIDPEEIEKAIYPLSPLISELAVTQRSGHLAAVIVPAKQSGSGAADAARAIIRDAILNDYNASAAEYRKIRQIIFCGDDLPRTRLGKLKRHLLADIQETQP